MDPFEITELARSNGCQTLGKSFDNLTVLAAVYFLRSHGMSVFFHSNANFKEEVCIQSER